MTERFIDPKIYFKPDEPPSAAKAKDIGEVQETQLGELVDFSDFFKYYDEAKEIFEANNRYGGDNAPNIDIALKYLEDTKGFEDALKDRRFSDYNIGVLINDIVQCEQGREYHLNQANSQSDEKLAKTSESSMYYYLQVMDLYLRLAKGASFSEAFTQTNTAAKDRFHNSVNYIGRYRRFLEGKEDSDISVEDAVDDNILITVDKFYKDEEQEVKNGQINERKTLARKYIDRIKEYLAKD